MDARCQLKGFVVPLLSTTIPPHGGWAAGQQTHSTTRRRVRDNSSARADDNYTQWPRDFSALLLKIQNLSSQRKAGMSSCARQDYRQFTYTPNKADACVLHSTDHQQYLHKEPGCHTASHSFLHHTSSKTAFLSPVASGQPRFAVRGL